MYLSMSQLYKTSPTAFEQIGVGTTADGNDAAWFPRNELVSQNVSETASFWSLQVAVGGKKDEATNISCAYFPK